MQLIVNNDYEEHSRTITDIVDFTIETKPDSAIVLATGNTPMDAYRELATRSESGEFNASEVRVFQLDANEEPR